MAELQHIAGRATQAKYEDPDWAVTPTQVPSDLATVTQKAIDMYMLSKRPNGEMGGIGWWQSANGYTSIALHDRWSQSQLNYKALSDVLRRCESEHKDFINEFIDDTLWWSLCCVHVYELGGEAWFLEKAKCGWQHVQRTHSICGRHQTSCCGLDMEGACFWTTKPGEDQVNAISSGLFSELSVRLAMIEHKSDKPSWLQTLGHHSDKFENYIEATRCSLGWILRCRYRADDGIVLDGFRLKEQVANDWTFTYTTGVVIGVCSLLYEATRQFEYVNLACHMAHKAMRNREWTESNGVLTERGAYGKGKHDPVQNNDAVGFKSILLRHLGVLYDVIVRSGDQSHSMQQTAMLIRSFVNINFASQQERNTNGNAQYGPWWNGPFEMPTSHSQMAVLDVMAAVVLVNRP